MTLPPMPKLDIRQALRVLPVRLACEGLCPGGQVGAAYVRRPDGHRSVLTRGPDVSPLLEVARAAGIPAPAYELVHPPYLVQELLPGDVPAGNVLVDAGGAITGVIDWDGVRRGDAALDLVTLRSDLAHRSHELHVDLPETAALRCWAHMSLRQVDWVIRHFSASEVTHWPEIAERLGP